MGFLKYLSLLVLLCIVGAVLFFTANKLYFDWTNECIKLDQNFRVTVNIETPEGIRSGSAVRNIRNSACKKQRKTIGESGNPARVRGEAVIIDLGERGQAFALINDLADSEFYQVFYGTGGGATTFDGIQKYLNLPNGTKGKLNPDKFPRYPMFVMFEDITDPKSVVMVRGGRFDPSTQTNIPVRDFVRIFGDGVLLSSIELEITDEHKSNKIDNLLTFLLEVNGGYLDGEFSGGGPELSNILHGGNFHREVKNNNK